MASYEGTIMGEFWETVTSERTKKLRKKLAGFLLKYGGVDPVPYDIYVELFELLENDLKDKIVMITEDGNVIISTELLKALTSLAKKQLEEQTPDEIISILKQDIKRFEENEKRNRSRL
jgi:hypothetical protein